MTKSIVALAALLLSCGTSPSAPADAAADVAADAQAPGAHVVQIDFGDTIDPTGNWVLVPLSQQGKTLPNLIDFATGQPTPLSLTTATWTTAGVDAKNWTAGDVDWLLAVVAQDALGGGTQYASTVTLDHVDGRYRVELVSATGFAFPTVQITVNGLTTATTKKGAANVDSNAWDPQAQGTNAGDWLVWPDVSPVNGTITISVQPGLLNALRLSPP